MKIFLVDPPFQRFMGYYRFYFPLGLTYLAANQSLDRAFVISIPQEKFLKIMNDVASFVAEHNAKHFVESADVRLKH